MQRARLVLLSVIFPTIVFGILAATTHSSPGSTALRESAPMSNSALRLAMIHEEDMARWYAQAEARRQAILAAAEKAAKDAARQERRRITAAAAARAARTAPVATISTETQTPTTPNSNRELGHNLMLERWGEDQWPCLDSLWTDENAWRTDRGGIPQAKPWTKMASAGPHWQTDAATQIRWGLGYIADRYGTPCKARAAFLSRSPTWY